MDIIEHIRKIKEHYSKPPEEQCRIQLESCREDTSLLDRYAESFLNAANLSPPNRKLFERLILEYKLIISMVDWALRHYEELAQHNNEEEAKDLLEMFPICSHQPPRTPQ